MRIPIAARLDVGSILHGKTCILKGENLQKKPKKSNVWVKPRLAYLRVLVPVQSSQLFIVLISAAKLSCFKLFKTTLLHQFWRTDGSLHLARLTHKSYGLIHKNIIKCSSRCQILERLRWLITSISINDAQKMMSSLQCQMLIKPMWSHSILKFATFFHPIWSSMPVWKLSKKIHNCIHCPDAFGTLGHPHKRGLGCKT